MFSSVQEYLRSTGDFRTSEGITGYYGPITQQAVKKWQLKNGVEGTGSFGPISRKKFEELMIKTISKKLGKAPTVVETPKKSEAVVAPLPATPTTPTTAPPANPVVKIASVAVPFFLKLFFFLFLVAAALIGGGAFINHRMKKK